LQKTVQLIGRLQKRVTRDGDQEDAAYNKYRRWCDESSGAKQNEVKALLKEKARLEANIELAETSEKASIVKIDELSAGASKAERKLEVFASDRKEEMANFHSTEEALMEALGTIDRALGLLKKEMQAGASASLLQATLDTPGLEGALMALGAVVDAAGGPEGERVQLLASLLQSQQEGQEGDSAGEASDKPQAGSRTDWDILEVMQDLKDDCNDELRKIRLREANAQHNYERLKEATLTQAKDLGKEMEEEKSDKAAAVEKGAHGKQDLLVVLATLKKTQESLKDVQDTCLRTASDHEQSAEARKEELKALAQAKKIIQSTMASSKVSASAAAAAASAASFLQTARGTSAAAADAEALRKRSRTAVALVGHLAVEQGSAELAQLAERLKAQVHAKGAPFAKVRSLMEGMLAKLKSEASQESKEKEYCDHELSKTMKKHEELADGKEDLKGKIAEGTSASAILKAQVKDLQGELAVLSKQQLDMDAARQSSHETYISAKADIEQGLAGVRSAIDTLREYYAADDSDASLLQTEDGASEELDQPAAPKKFQKSTSTGNSIIGLLEVCMSDLAQSLSKEEAEEQDKDDEYQKLTTENKELAKTKEQAIVYKTREFKMLEASIVEFANDYDDKSQEYGAVKSYLAKVKERCIVASESFEERRKRRDANVAGLREALAVLKGSRSDSSSDGSQRAGFLQQRSPRQSPPQQVDVV